MGIQIQDSKGKFAGLPPDRKEMVTERIREWSQTPKKSRPQIVDLIRELDLPRSTFYWLLNKIRVEDRMASKQKVHSTLIAEVAMLKQKGLNNTEISESVGRSPETIRRVVDEADMDRLCKSQRLALAEALPQCVASVVRGIDNDPRLAKEVLDDFGVTPHGAAAIEGKKNGLGGNITIVIPPLPERAPLPAPKPEFIDVQFSSADPK